MPFAAGNLSGGRVARRGRGGHGSPASECVRPVARGGSRVAGGERLTYSTPLHARAHALSPIPGPPHRPHPDPPGRKDLAGGRQPPGGVAIDADPRAPDGGGGRPARLPTARDAAADLGPQIPAV